MDQRHRFSILIVDDDPEVRSQLAWVLRGRFDLRLAASVDAALALLREGGPPDVALVDLHLSPDRDAIDAGVGLIEIVKRSAPDGTVLAITGRPTDEAESRSRRAGAELLLSKPIAGSALCRLLEERTGATRPGGTRRAAPVGDPEEGG